MSKSQIDKQMFDQEVRQYISKPESLALIERAFNYAQTKHENQLRKSGEPYFIHLLNVAYILAKLRVGPKTIVAGFLHDVIEDCGISKEKLAEEFDDEVATLVESVTKIKNLKFTDEDEYLASNHRKIFIAMAKDIRVILIKLVDRLHNMRTLSFQPEDRQKKISQETLDVYAPIAHRLGISEIKNELEDLAFFYLNREAYYEIARLVEKKKTEREQNINEAIVSISALLLENNIRFRIFGRSKHLYSIYKKMTVKNKRFEEILDLQAIRIVTESELNCYEVLGHIHAAYRPIPGRLKDYIAMPKMNMYQSLHTTIVCNDEQIYEIQIRTEVMDQIAEQGIAAHWRYKEGRGYNPEKEQREIEEKLSWFKDMTLMTADVNDDATEYMNVLQRDLFEANIYVMTPKGRVIDLPNGSIPLDFAYRIHTDVGHATIGAMVNGILVPLNTKLKTGDVVQIKTTKNNPSPSEDWLKIVKTTHARNKIRQYYIKKEQEDRAELITKGEQMLKEDLRKHELDEKTYMDKDKLEKVYGAFSVSNYGDFMHAIATKSLTTQAVIDKLTNKKPMFDLSKLFVNKPPRKAPSKTGVNVAGIETMMVTLANCCNPIPGDEIVGFITKGAGVKVHRTDCVNVRNQMRLINVEWDEVLVEKRNYECKIVVTCHDRSYLLSDIINVVSQFKVTLTEVNSKSNEETITAVTYMTILVSDSEHLRLLTANLRKIEGVINVERIANN